MKEQDVMHVTRFAPSPTGYLHLGHAYAALIAQRESVGGRFLLRIEDIDVGRCRSEYADAIIEDLSWLGLKWEEPVRFQSQHMEDYVEVLKKLRDIGVLYPCFCTRSDIAREAAKSASAPHAADGTLIYTGTCKKLSAQECDDRLASGSSVNWRLDVELAAKMAGNLFWHDRTHGKIKATPEMFGDVVLARKDIKAGYHLCVTLDDHLQGVTLVTRGEDLFASTHVHRLLQALLGFNVPEYFHHPLVLDENGKRYAKRDKSVTLRALKNAGEDPGVLRGKLAV